MSKKCIFRNGRCWKDVNNEFYKKHEMPVFSGYKFEFKQHSSVIFCIYQDLSDWHPLISKYAKNYWFHYYKNDTAVFVMYKK